MPIRKRRGDDIKRATVTPAFRPTRNMDNIWDSDGKACVGELQ